MKNDRIKNKWVNYSCLDQIGHQTRDLYLSYAGIEFCAPDHSYGPTIRKEYVLHIIFKGHGFYTVQGETYNLKAEQAFLLPPGIPTQYHANPNDPYAYVWVAFNGERINDYLAQTALSVEKPVCDLMIPSSEFRTLVEKILDTKDLKISNDIKRVGLLYVILAKLIASNNQLPNVTTPLYYPTETYAEHALQYIEINYNHITIQDVVNHVGLNRSYLYTIFKQKFLVSPQEYLISYRLKKATELLCSTTNSISDIAKAIGYEDPFTFSKVFKKYYGMSPKFFRKNNSIVKE